MGLGSNWFPCQLFSPSSLCLGEKAVQSHCYINFTIITHFDQVNTIFERHYGIGSTGDTIIKVKKWELEKFENLFGILSSVVWLASCLQQIYSGKLKGGIAGQQQKLKNCCPKNLFLISGVFRSFVIISCQLVNTTSKLVKMSAPETLKLIHFQTFHFYQSLSANRLHKSISLILLFLKTVSYGYAWFNISNHSSFWTFCGQ